jgi:hypothetical protein
VPKPKVALNPKHPERIRWGCDKYPQRSFQDCFGLIRSLIAWTLMFGTVTKIINPY